MANILVIEDDQRIRELVCEHLARDGHGATSEANGLDGLRALTASRPDILVMDLGLPDLDGIDLLRMVRSVADLPILVLTAREDEATILAAFAEGADDYVVKPVSGPQLTARITALLRRGGTDEVEHLVVGLLELHLGPRTVHLRGEPLELTAKEFDMLAHLAARHGSVVSKEELHAAVWKAPAGTEGRTVDVHLSNLRRKMGETATSDDRYLHTAIGAGIRLQAPGA
jgi:two-component system response regulator PrrA